MRQKGPHCPALLTRTVQIANTCSFQLAEAPCSRGSQPLRKARLKLQPRHVTFLSAAFVPPSPCSSLRRKMRGAGHIHFSFLSCFLLLPHLFLISHGSLCTECGWTEDHCFDAFSFTYSTPEISLWGLG